MKGRVDRRLAAGAIALVAAAFLTQHAFADLPRLLQTAACPGGEAVAAEMLCYLFMWRALLTGLLVGVACPVIGVYLVHREMALIGETLAHTAFAGVGFGFLAAAVYGFEATPEYMMVAALLAALAGAFAVQYLADLTEGHGDVPIAITLTGSFAVGTLVISYTDAAFVDVESYIFGSMVAVSTGSLRMMAALTVVVVGTIALTYKQLFYITFDEQAARVARLDVSFYNSLLVFLTAVVVVGAMQILGVILVAALIVTPVAAAAQVADGFRDTLYLSVAAGEASVVVGLAAAYSYGLAAAGSIVAVSIALYLAAVTYSTVDVDTSNLPGIR